MKALANHKIVITATFTSEPVEDSLSYWLKKIGFPYSIEFAQYNQVFQELLNPASLLATNQNGVNVILVRFEDWEGSKNKAELTLEQTLRDFGNALKTATMRSPIPYLVCVCPPSPTHDTTFNSLHEKLQEQLDRDLQNIPSIYLIKSQALLKTYPVQEYYDPYGE